MKQELFGDFPIIDIDFQNISKWTGTKKIIFVYLFFVSLVIIFTTLHMRQEIELTEIQYKITRIEKKMRVLIREINLEKVELAKYSNLSDIEKIAREKLKMVDPVAVQILEINP